jgi:hypothetical protein
MRGTGKGKVRVSWRKRGGYKLLCDLVRHVLQEDCSCRLRNRTGDTSDREAKGDKGRGVQKQIRSGMN